MAPLQVRDDPFVRGLVPTSLSLAVEVLHAQGVAVVPVEDDLPLFDRQLAKRLVHGDLVAASDSLDQVVIEVGRAAPGADGALAKRPVLVGDHQVGIDLELAAQPGARRTGAVRVIERKIPRRELFHREAVVGAGEVLTEEQFLAFPLGRHHQHEAGGHLGCGLDRFAQPADALLLDHQPVDHDLDVVLLVFVQLDALS